ncbi:hypothetical protein [Paenibacillus periandrae]|uniref:hypothetical protein n=1 Tax=Paenibacillus periandrae TaxID=1761741 RepID=UPI001F08CAEB|nr:hypothetical protein [Paenibacillus periandrae]
MDKLYVRLMVIGFVTGFCIFVGLMLVNRAVERSHEPVVIEAAQQREPESTESALQVKAEPDKTNVDEASKETTVKEKVESEEQRTVISKATGVGRLGNKIGGLLQILAHYGIQGVVALFEAITA